MTGRPLPAAAPALPPPRIARAAGALAFLAPLLAGLLLLLGYYVYDRATPVFTAFHVARQWPEGPAVMIEGVLDANRDCELLDVVAQDSAGDVTGVRTPNQGPHTRPLGPRTFGPWTVLAARGAVVLYAHRRCNALFEHTDELGTFIAGETFE